MALCISIDRLDANIEEITVGRWIKQVGDPVAIGEPVVEIITDKITFEYESEGEGVLRVIVAPEKSVVPVHYVIGVVAGPDEPLPDYESHNRSLLARLAEGGGPLDAVAATAGPAADAIPRSDRVRATPAARRRARELGVDIAKVAGTVSGTVQVEDVECYAARQT